MDNAGDSSGSMPLNAAITAAACPAAAVSHSVPSEEVNDQGLANIKEKTPMCLVNELARFNKISHQVRIFSIALSCSPSVVLTRLGSGPQGWDFGLETGIWASRLGLGPRGWNLDLKTGI